MYNKLIVSLYLEKSGITRHAKRFQRSDLSTYFKLLVHDYLQILKFRIETSALPERKSYTSDTEKNTQRPASFVLLIQACNSLFTIHSKAKTILLNFSSGFFPVHLKMVQINHACFAYHTLCIYSNRNRVQQSLASIKLGSQFANLKKIK